MLDLLAAYASEHGMVATPGLRRKRVRWLLAFGADGQYLAVVPYGDPDAGAVLVCPDLKPGEMFRAKTRHFLVDRAEVAVLLTTHATVSSKQKRDHASFLKLLGAASEAMPPLAKIANTLSDAGAVAKMRDDLRRNEATPNDNVTFQMDGHLLLDSSAWLGWWQEFRASLAMGDAKSRMRCFATGEIVEPARTHWPVRGLSKVGGRGAGDVMVCFNKDAFVSYGLGKTSLNAAVSADAAVAYRDALEELITGGADLVQARVVHWFKDRVQLVDDPFDWLPESRKEQELNARQRAKQLFGAITEGKRPDLAGNRYYAMTLSGSDGRVMVRDWMDGEFGELVESVNRWFEDLLIQDIFGNDGKSPGIEHIITSLLPPRGARQEYDAWVRPIGSERFALWYAAVRRGPIPLNALGRLVLQNRSFTVTGTLEEALKGNEPKAKRDAVSLLQVRMGLMKAYHLRKTNIGGYLKPFLDEEHPSAAYHCGRLMAVMARLQRTVMPEVRTGVVQRYYAAASATPALVLGRLERLSKFHLGSLGRDKPGLAVWYDQTMASIHSRIDPRALPKALTLEEQSLFALGYYQQLAFRKPDDADIEEKTNE
jgi:CRISPR-associated protein Csd1